MANDHVFTHDADGAPEQAATEEGGSEARCTPKDSIALRQAATGKAQVTRAVV